MIMLWQTIHGTTMSLLWNGDRITRCCSWVLALSSLFWVGVYMGSGLAVLSKPPKIHVPQTNSNGSAFNNTVKRYEITPPSSNSSDEKKTTTKLDFGASNNGDMGNAKERTRP